ncbi:membrane protein implicated in regulation of membrane protease activity [Nostoc linckia z18]|jgi:membrane protein implicated in regulation of membrane protease activity|uniref:Membrane protein implicated in regulation of membrane protease activity n=3 Tax=Nostoc TaxID=1177 RepID=A0A9Q5ZDW1_NOSLI|nr:MULTISPECIES: NfeD family protein [Nostoc]MBL1198749.1 NfeD family protein [Nostoc sp. GBBB01]MDZ8013833.1 NfeD family protein [Nostoc sp. ZfuVER08]PHK40065.1 membrane protein implicated in regulation of membrane protease activity [Nostoc linckia z15]PHK47019.1 membrane protein implicated in regulation of membrane protease activity [Nostoc linckia z16]MBD2613484.1 NfeD family protein [Nostoc punctiforme FACHB-252]
MPSFTLIWLLAGAVLCLTELFLPSAFVAFMMGISAFVVALLSGVGLTNLWLQILIWLLLSTTLIVVSRRFLQPRRRNSKIQNAVTAETLTEIPPGKTGRVLYEGNSWQARCDDDKFSIAPHQKVYVVRREGTTLIVIPENLLHS